MHFKVEYIIYIIIGLVWLFNNFLSNKKKESQSAPQSTPNPTPTHRFPTEIQDVLEDLFDLKEKPNPQEPVFAGNKKPEIRADNFDNYSDYTSSSIESASYESISQGDATIDANSQVSTLIEEDKESKFLTKSDNSVFLGLVDLKQAFIHTIILDRPYK